MNILIVEDDHDLAETICEYLEMDGFICHHALNGMSGLNFACENRFQVILLDLNLPKIDGISLCRTLRAKGDDTPILMLTARDGLNDKLEGFTAGTDDYLVKPFALEELSMRIKALSKRKSGQISRLSCGTLEMNINSKTVMRENIVLKMSPFCWKLLEVLLRASPDVVPKAELEATLWGEDIPDSNALKVHIHTLRKTVDAPFPHQLIHTVSRHGFALYESV